MVDIEEDEERDLKFRLQPVNNPSDKPSTSATLKAESFNHGLIAFPYS
jgi:hypothetical protein